MRRVLGWLVCIASLCMAWIDAWHVLSPHDDGLVEAAVTPGVTPSHAGSLRPGRGPRPAGASAEVPLEPDVRPHEARAPTASDPRLAKHLDTARRKEKAKDWAGAQLALEQARQAAPRDPRVRDWTRRREFARHAARARKAEVAERLDDAIAAWTAAGPFAADRMVVDEAVRALRFSKLAQRAEAALGQKLLGPARAAITAAEAFRSSGNEEQLERLRLRASQLEATVTVPAQELTAKLHAVQSRLRQVELDLGKKERALHGAAKAISIESFTGQPQGKGLKLKVLK